jgi:hypothetical protein
VVGPEHTRHFDGWWTAAAAAAGFVGGEVWEEVEEGEVVVDEKEVLEEGYEVIGLLFKAFELNETIFLWKKKLRKARNAKDIIEDVNDGKHRNGHGYSLIYS